MKLAAMASCAVLLCPAASCSSRYASEEGLLHLSGVVQVLGQGTLSETIILETPGGEYYALVGDVAPELRESWGAAVSLTGRPVELEGWPVRPELPRIWVVDCVVEGEPTSGDYPGD